MWTKSQKISAGVLGLAVVAFCVDRWVLSSGSPSANAAATSEYAVNPSTPTKPIANSERTSGAAAKSAVSANQGTTLASRLASISESKRLEFEAIGDAFRPADEWLASADPSSVPGSDSAGGDKSGPARVDVAADFRTTHKLTAVLTKKSGSKALVDGKPYAAGQTIDGFTLTKVGVTDATFEGHGTSVVLSLPIQAPLSSGR